MDYVEKGIQELTEKVKKVKPIDLEKCNTCYLKQKYGTSDKPLTVRKLITHLLQENMDDCVGIEIDNHLVYIKEEDYLVISENLVTIAGETDPESMPDKTNYQMYIEAKQYFELYGRISNEKIAELFSFKRRMRGDLINLKDYITIITLGCGHQDKNDEKSVAEHKSRCELMERIKDAISAALNF